MNAMHTCMKAYLLNSNKFCTKLAKIHTIENRKDLRYDILSSLNEMGNPKLHFGKAYIFCGLV